MSSAKIKKEAVIEACKDIIFRINERRAYEDEQFLKRKMEWPNRFRHLFGVRKLTMEDMKEKYSRVSVGFVYPSIYAWGDLSVATELLELAEMAEEYVEVSADEWWALAR